MNLINKQIEERLENNVDFVPIAVEGAFDIPVIKPEVYTGEKFVPFNMASSITRPVNTGIHFFIHDYLFQRMWGYRNKYADMLLRFGTAMTPDFSTYTDYPVMVQMFNHYRKHLLGAWMQDIGVKVYPTISWSDESSYKWCFDGEPHHGTVCLGSVGTQKQTESKRLFLKGYDRMMEILEPETVIFYGEVPKECTGNIVTIPAYYNEIVGRRKK